MATSEILPIDSVQKENQTNHDEPLMTIAGNVS